MRPFGYPVIYWFHGYSERHNKPWTIPRIATTTVSSIMAATRSQRMWAGTMSSWSSGMAAIPPHAPTKNIRGLITSALWNAAQFPLYFPGLVSTSITAIAPSPTVSTAPLRASPWAAPCASFWLSGKYPDMVSHASNFMGSSEFLVSPRTLSEYRHEEFADNYDGVRTRLRLHPRFHSLLSPADDRPLEVHAPVVRNGRVRFRSRHTGHFQNF